VKRPLTRRELALLGLLVLVLGIALSQRWVSVAELVSAGVQGVVSVAAAAALTLKKVAA
jgi:hypothetical protein